MSMVEVSKTPPAALSSRVCGDLAPLLRGEVLGRAVCVKCLAEEVTACVHSLHPQASAKHLAPLLRGEVAAAKR